MRRQGKIALVTLVAVGAVFFTLAPLTQQSTDGVTHVQSQQDRTQLITTTGLHLLELQDEIYDALLGYEQEQSQRHLEERRDSDREISRISDVLKNQLGREQELLSGYRASREQMARAEERFIDAVGKGRADDAKRFLEEIAAQKRIAAAKLHELLSDSNGDLRSVIDHAKSGEIRRRWTLIARAMTLGFVICVLLLIIWSILRPLRQLPLSQFHG